MNIKYTSVFEIIIYFILLLSIVLFIIGVIMDITLMIYIPVIIVGIITLFFLILNTYRIIVYGIGKDKR